MTIKIDINHSLETEAKQIYHSAWYAMKNFYFPNGWYLLSPEANFKPSDPVVLLPKLDYSQIDFHSLNRDDLSIGLLQYDDLTSIRMIRELIKNKVVILDQRSKNRWYKQVNKLLVSTFAKLAFLLDKFEFSQVLINVSLSRFGSYGSFDKAMIDDQGRLIIGVQPRLDQQPEVVLELVVSSLVQFHLQTDNQFFVWRDKEAIVDFVVKYILGQSQVVSTLGITDRNRPDLLKQSLEFLHQVNLPIFLPLEYDSGMNRILIMGKDVSLDFGPYEFRVLRALILNQGRTVTHDQLADFLYQVYPENRFSLWSITKVIQRLRDKLEQFGFPRRSIQTVRGEGFRLIQISSPALNQASA